jgi:hypothetical protein
MTPATVDQSVLLARSAAEVQPRSPTNVNEYAPAIWARLRATFATAAALIAIATVTVCLVIGAGKLTTLEA